MATTKPCLGCDNFVTNPIICVTCPTFIVWFSEHNEGKGTPVYAPTAEEAAAKFCRQLDFRLGAEVMVKDAVTNEKTKFWVATHTELVYTARLIGETHA